METLEILALLQRTYESVVEPRFRSLAESDVKEKKPGDLVTVADQESEIEITQALTQRYPEALIVGEEAYSPEIAKAFVSAEHAFTIDPIDGTANFVHGKNDFALMVSQTRNNEVIRSWILQPRYQRAYIAEAGAGFWHVEVPTGTDSDNWNLERITHQGVILEQPEIWRGLSSVKAVREHTYKQLGNIIPSAFSCGIDYPNLASGNADFAVYTHEWPWDHAPGLLMLQETGGGVVRYDGTRYEPQIRQPGSLIALNDIRMAPQVLADVGPVIAAK